jgi:hypothetical protein
LEPEGQKQEPINPKRKPTPRSAKFTKSYSFLGDYNTKNLDILKLLELIIEEIDIFSCLESLVSIH